MDDIRVCAGRGCRDRAWYDGMCWSHWTRDNAWLERNNWWYEPLDAVACWFLRRRMWWAYRPISGALEWARDRA